MLLSFLGLVAVAGCSNGGDPTMNQQDPSAANYPAGPYGYVEGQIIENIKLIGKIDPQGAAGTATYDTLPMQTVSLADYHADATVKFVAISGVAGWCGPCNAEQQFVPNLQATYEPKGVRFFEAMIQGYDARSGAPATEDDINRWQRNHDIHVGVGLDPEDQIHKFADVAAFPLNMVVSTSDMKIVFMSVGEQDLDPTLAQLTQ
jgi:hypothetical protein